MLNITYAQAHLKGGHTKRCSSFSLWGTFEVLLLGSDLTALESCQVQHHEN